MAVWLEMLRRGKHRGRRFEDVAAIDRGYCAWVLREKVLPLHSFYRYLIKAHGGILNVGKHKGRFFDKVLEGGGGVLRVGAEPERAARNPPPVHRLSPRACQEGERSTRGSRRAAGEEVENVRNAVRSLFR